MGRPHASFAIISRDRNLPALKQLGFVKVIARGPSRDVIARMHCFELRRSWTPFIPRAVCKTQAQAQSALCR